MIEILRQQWPVLLKGAGLTVALSVLGYLGSLVLGTIIAIFRVSPIPPLRGVGTVYVEFFRNIPLLSLLILLVFGLPKIGIQLDLFPSAVLGLLLSGAAFTCETVRSGINTVSVGQSEASRALGMTFLQQLTLIILPQAFRTMIQPLVNVFIGVIIGSSLCAAVGVKDLTNTAQQLNIQYAEAVILFALSGVVYLVFSLGVGRLGGRLERAAAAPQASSGGAL